MRLCWNHVEPLIECTFHPTDCSKVTFFVQFPLHQNLLPQPAEQVLLWKLETAFQHCADPVDRDGSYCLA